MSRSVKATLRGCAPALLVALILAPMLPGVARAGGFFILPRGARASVLGGAQVAGGDDPGTLWLNPAALVRSGDQALLDFVLPVERVSYQRVNAGGEIEPEVSAVSEPLPIPGVAISHSFGVENFGAGFGVLSPAAALLEWPRCVDDPFAGPETPPIPGCPQGQMGAPQRHSIISMMGSGFVTLKAGAAYRLDSGLSFGASLDAFVGRVAMNVVMNACDSGVLCGQPESETWDANALILVPFAVAPSATFGVLYERAWFSLGAGVSLPMTMAGEATLQMDLPTSARAEFRGAELSSDRASFEIDFPARAQVGVQLKPRADLRMELQLGWEGWSVQEAMRVEPIDMRVMGAAAIGDYEIGPIEMPRGMQDVFSVGLGGELDLNRRWRLMSGLMWERSSLPDAFMTIALPDTEKLVAGLGLSFQLSDDLALDFGAGHVFMEDRDICNSKLYQPSPLRPAPPPDQGDCRSGTWEPGEAVPLGNGRYDMEASFVSLGLRKSLGAWSGSQGGARQPAGTLAASQ